MKKIKALVKNLFSSSKSQNYITPTYPLIGDKIEVPISRKEKITTSNILGGKYIVNTKISGGHGEVLLCTFSNEKNTSIVLKTFKKKYFFNKDIRQSFIREACIWTQLTGSGCIFPLFGIESIEGRIYLMTPLVKPNTHGEVTLRDNLNNRTNSFDNILRNSYELLYGLNAAQKVLPEVVHGDLKPENILMWNDSLWITDFGLSKVLTDPHGKDLNLDTTWAYKAPELWSSPNNFSVKSDIYAIGIIMYELLTNSLPFTGQNKDEWKDLHIKQEVTPPKKYDGYEKRLWGIIKLCVAKDVNERFDNFEEILQKIEILWKSYNTNQLQKHREKIDNLQLNLVRLIEHRPAMIKSLYSIQEYELALKLIEQLESYDIKSDGFRGMSSTKKSALSRLYKAAVVIDLLKDPNYLCIKASVLSLNNRDVEAIEEFNKAFKIGFKDKEQEYSYLNELALSYRRIKEYEKAEKIYEDILAKGLKNESIICAAYVNWALVKIELKDFKKAILLLREGLKIVPNNIHCIVNLGDAYHEMENFEEACKYYKKAIKINPYMETSYTRLAKSSLYLKEHFTATSALRSHDEQGFATTHEWAYTYITYLRLTNQQDSINEYISVIKQQSGSEIATKTEEKSLSLFQEIQNFSQGIRKSSKKTSEIITQNVQDTSSTESSKNEFTEPFLNTRLYGGTGYYSVDFYYSPDNGDFVERFNRVKNKIKQNDDAVYQMTDLPFYFSKCTECQIYIFTNRKLSKNLCCRRCKTDFYTYDVTATEENNQRLSEILDTFNTYSKEELDRLAIIFFHPKSNDEKVIIEKICNENNYRLLPKDRELARKVHIQAAMHSDAYSLGDFEELIFFTKQLEIHTSKFSHNTPPEVELLVREVRKKIKIIKSFSGIFNIDDELLVAMSKTRKEYLIWLEEKVDRNSNDVSLIDIAQRYMEFKEYEKTQTYAEKALNLSPSSDIAWELIGLCYLHKNDYQKAAKYFEECLKIEPTSMASLLSLTTCYKELGQNDKLNAVLMRLHGLGGINI